MTIKPTLTIGVVAYNESANIGKLLLSLKKQIISSAHLLRIVVISDASIDGTDEIVNTIGDIQLIRHRERQGANAGQNDLLTKTETDLLVILDADILPNNDLLIENLIAPIVANSHIGLTSGMLIPAKPRTFVEKVLARTHIFKIEFFSKLPNKNNIYLCVGPIRAFSKGLYSSYIYPDQVPYDAYSYLKCLQNGYQFEYVPHAQAIFRCPATLSDHEKQGARFAAGRQQLIEEFKQDAVIAYRLPQMRIVASIVPEVVRHPILSLFAAYFLILFFSRMLFQQQKFTSKWEMAASSKNI